MIKVEEVKLEDASPPPPPAQETQDAYDEDADEDYDPSARAEPQSESDTENQPDYSHINTGVSQVRTRTQRLQEAGERTVVVGKLSIDVDAVFSLLGNLAKDEWLLLIQNGVPREEPRAEEPDAYDTAKVRIETSYTFAGKLVRELKLVDADLAEAKAYLNLTSVVQLAGDSEQRKLAVVVVRRVAGTGEEVPLRIKLKRPSLIDKFLQSFGDKKLKLTTLEKSRLDWASFVDKKSIKDELHLHNKSGYLDKQDFLGRMDAKQDQKYRAAKEADRKRQWLLQQRG